MATNKKITDIQIGTENYEIVDQAARTAIAVMGGGSFEDVEIHAKTADMAFTAKTVLRADQGMMFPNDAGKLDLAYKSSASCFLVIVIYKEKLSGNSGYTYNTDFIALPMKMFETGVIGANGPNSLLGATRDGSGNWSIGLNNTTNREIEIGYMLELG